MAAIRFLIAGAILLAWEASLPRIRRPAPWRLPIAAASGATRRSSAAPPARRRDGHGRARREDRPGRASRRSSSRCCRSGWRSSAGSSSASGCRSWSSPGSSSGSSGSSSSSARSTRRSTGVEPFHVLACHRLADVLGLGLALLVAPGGAAASSADRDRAPDDLRRSAPAPRLAVLVRRARRRSTWRPSRRARWLGLALPHDVGSLVGFTTYVWLLRVAPLPKIATYAYVNPVVALSSAASSSARRSTPRTVLAGRRHRLRRGAHRDRPGARVTPGHRTRAGRRVAGAGGGPPGRRGDRRAVVLPAIVRPSDHPCRRPTTRRSPATAPDEGVR